MPPPTEVDAWLDLRVRLWPERSRAELAADRGLVLCDPARNALLAAADDGRQVGSTEVPLRDWAEGCKARPVADLGGWYVEPDARGAGVGRALLESGERWVHAHGVTEMASDADPENAVSLAHHGRMDFREIALELLVAKRLAP